MLTLSANLRIYLCTTPTDMRKSFDGLSGLVEAVFEQKLLDGHLFLFLNRRRDRIKLLHWDRDGLVIWYKRLEIGTFETPPSSAEQAHVELDAVCTHGDGAAERGQRARDQRVGNRFLRQVAGFEKLPSTAELIAWVRVLHASGVDSDQLKKIRLADLPFPGAIVKSEEDTAVLARQAD